MLCRNKNKLFEVIFFQELWTNYISSRITEVAHCFISSYSSSCRVFHCRCIASIHCQYFLIYNFFFHQCEFVKYKLNISFKSVFMSSAKASIVSAVFNYSVYEQVLWHYIILAKTIEVSCIDFHIAWKSQFFFVNFTFLQLQTWTFSFMYSIASSLSPATITRTIDLLSTR